MMLIAKTTYLSIVPELWKNIRRLAHNKRQCFQDITLAMLLTFNWVNNYFTTEESIFCVNFLEYLDKQIINVMFLGLLW